MFIWRLEWAILCKLEELLDLDETDEFDDLDADDDEPIFLVFYFLNFIFLFLCYKYMNIYIIIKFQTN
jgi:hypothetical protein